MITLCADCGEHFDAEKGDGGDPDCGLCNICYQRRFECASCGEPAADPDEDPPATRLTCKECLAIARADHQRDVEKDERAERRAGVKP